MLSTHTVLGEKHMELSYCIGVIIINNSDKEDKLIRELMASREELKDENFIVEHDEITWDGIYQMFVGIEYSSTVIGSSDNFEVIDEPKYSDKLEVLDKLKEIGIYDYSEKELVMVMI